MILINYEVIIGFMRLTILWGEYRYHRGRSSGLDDLKDAIKKMHDMGKEVLEKEKDNEHR